MDSCCKLSSLFLTITGCGSILILLSVTFQDFFPELGGLKPREDLLQRDRSGSESGGVWTPNGGRPPLPERAPDGSRCEEIFNIGAGGPLGNVSESLLKRIREAKSGGDPWDFDLDAYDQLSSSMPSLLPPRGKNGSSGFLVGGPGEAKSVWVPWLPCRLHLYQPLEVNRCFLRRSRKKLSNSVVFIGDSKTRRTFQAVGKLLQEMDVTYLLYDRQRLNWTAYNGENINKRHDNQVLTSGLVPGFQFWQVYMGNFSETSSAKVDEREARKIFMELLNLPAGERPALVVINFGAWHLRWSNKESLRGLDEFHSDLMASVNIIRALAKCMPVVLWLSDPYKSPRYVRCFHTNDKLELITKDFLWKLRDSDVILWDSTLPVAWANQRDCRVVEEDVEGYGHLFTMQDWYCFDYVHLGFVPLAFRAQVLINYLCNGVEGRKDVCCTRGSFWENEGWQNNVCGPLKKV